jgi:hypothetical protein
MYGIGVCNDDLNIRECFFDNGDCCTKNVNATFCAVCKCHADQRYHAEEPPILFERPFVQKITPYTAINGTSLSKLSKDFFLNVAVAKGEWENLGTSRTINVVTS